MPGRCEPHGAAGGVAFGAGLFVWQHVIIAVLAAREVGRPVKVVLTRPQMFTGVGHRPGSLQTIRIGAQRDGELIANHIPFLLDPIRGKHGTLMGHVARANNVWQSFSTSVSSVVVFQGTETYISPSWYPSKHAHGKAVPTWNYAVVHAHGLPRVIEDRDWLFAHINQLTDANEAGQAVPS